MTDTELIPKSEADDRQSTGSATTDLWISLGCPDHGPYVGCSAAEIILNTMDWGREHKADELTAHLKWNGCNAGYLGSAMTYLVPLGFVKRVRHGWYVKLRDFPAD
jgi:hypothetical protein